MRRDEPGRKTKYGAILQTECGIYMAGAKLHRSKLSTTNKYYKGPPGDPDQPPSWIV
jgi:hypothetical protein